MRGMSLLSCLPSVHLPQSSLLPWDLSALPPDRQTPGLLLSLSLPPLRFGLLSAPSPRCFEIHTPRTGMAGAVTSQGPFACLTGQQACSDFRTFPDVGAAHDRLLSALSCTVSAAWRPHLQRRRWAQKGPCTLKVTRAPRWLFSPAPDSVPLLPRKETCSQM